MTLAETTLNNLVKKGLRRTRLRRAVLEVLFESRSPLSVTEMKCALSKQGIRPNKTSLYREMEILLRTSVAEETTISGTRKIYISESGHHHHFVCTACKETLCVSSPELESRLAQVQQILQKKEGLTVLEHDLTFYGLCTSCNS